MGFYGYVEIIKDRVDSNSYNSSEDWKTSLDSGDKSSLKTAYWVSLLIWLKAVTSINIIIDF